MEKLGDAITRVRPRARSINLGKPEELPELPSCPICKDYGFVRKDVPLGDPDFGKAITFPFPT